MVEESREVGAEDIMSEWLVVRGATRSPGECRSMALGKKCIFSKGPPRGLVKAHDTKLQPLWSSQAQVNYLGSPSH